MESIYLDHAATTPVDPRVFEAMTPYFCEEYGNPSSLHTMGQNARKALDNSRKTVTGLLGCDPREIIFTGSGTESDNLAIFGIAEAYADQGKHIITTAIEHPAVLGPCKVLEKQGFNVTYLPVDEAGLISLDELEAALTDETILVSIIYGNNEIGTVQPIPEIAKILKNRKDHSPLFHTDACQVVCSEPLDMDELGVDLMTLNGSKTYGPKGVGLLCRRTKIELSPQITGGGHEFNLRSGTENIPGIVGFTKALKIARDELQHNVDHLVMLRDQLYDGLTKNLPDLVLNGPPLDAHRLPHILNLTIPGVEGEILLLKLDMAGVCASAGSACSSGKTEPSHVLTAIGRSKQEAYQSIRFSLGRFNTEKEIDHVIQSMTEIVNEARSESGTY